MNCPHCRTTLLMSERQGVEIDYCPDCRGVWLDRGELDKIIQRNATEAAGVPVAPAPPVPSYRPDDRRPDDRDRRDRDERDDRDRRERDDRDRDWSQKIPSGSSKKKKSKSFLEDIFDF